MNKTKDYFKYYIFGYLNVYYTDLGLHNNNKELFRAQRKMDVIHYLHLKNKWKDIFLCVSPALTHIESLISLSVVLFQFVLVALKYPFCQKRKRTHSSELMYGTNKNFDSFYKLIDSARLDQNKLVVILPPLGKYPYERKYVCDSLLSGLSLCDMFQSLVLSIRMIFFMSHRYRKNDCFFRAYSSFEFFLMCFFFEKCENTIINAALIDRRAFLYGHLDKKVVFIQHGKVPEKNKASYLIKIGKADEGYFIDEHQKDLCLDELFTNNPIVNYLDSFTFTSDKKLIVNGKKNVLLVCNHLFLEEEERIINYLISEKIVNLYVKPHPHDEPGVYKKILNGQGILLEKTDYPHVDIVVSYDSTLALEYKNAGVDVIYHDKSNYLDLLNKFIEL